MEKFSFKNRYGLEIVGYVKIPENPIGLVFEQHGLGSFKEHVGVQAVVDSFSEHNYIVVNFDSTNSVNESGGKYEDATLGKHCEDLIDVIDWAKDKFWYQEPFILSGHSLGGFSVIEYAENFPQKVKGIFAFAPTISGKFSFEANEKYSLETFKSWRDTGWNSRISNSKPGIEKRLPWSHMEERLNHDLLPGTDNLTMPVLILVGENDTSCPPEHQKVLFENLKCPKDLFIIPGAPHTFRSPEDLSELKKILNDWLKKI